MALPAVTRATEAGDHPGDGPFRQHLRHVSSPHLAAADGPNVGGAEALSPRRSHVMAAPTISLAVLGAVLLACVQGGWCAAPHPAARARAEHESSVQQQQAY